MLSERKAQNRFDQKASRKIHWGINSIWVDSNVVLSRNVSKEECNQQFGLHGKYKRRRDLHFINQILN